MRNKTSIAQLLLGQLSLSASGTAGDTLDLPITSSRPISITRSSAVGERPRDASSLSVVIASIVRYLECTLLLLVILRLQIFECI